MPFQCPACQGTLRITASLELPPDSRSDEITLQIVKCGECGFEAIGIYEESRRGALGTESVDHRGFRIDAADLRALRRQIRSCPRPNDPHCDCAAHQALGRTDSSGRWAGVSGLKPGAWFPMKP
jgi:hypothetical protein